MALPNIDDLKTPEELAQIRERIQLLESRLKKLDQGQLDLEGEDADSFEAESLKAGADAYMEYDPDTAQQWTQKADEIKAKREASKNKPDGLIDDLRATHNAYLNNLSSLYAQGAQSDDPRVVNAQKMVDATANELRKRGLPFGTAEEKKVETVEDGDKLAKAREEAKSVMNTAVDVDSNKGVFDNRDAILTQLDDIAQREGINRKSQAWQDILGLFKQKEETLDRNTKEAQRKEEQGYARAQKEKADAKSSTSINAERAKQAIFNLESSVNTTSVLEALNTLLRGETGAAIAKDETMGRIATVLPPNKADQALNELSGLQGLIASNFKADEQFTLQMVRKYAPSVDPNLLIAQLRIRAGEKAQRNPETKVNAQEPQRKDYKSLTDYAKAMKAYNDALKAKAVKK